MSVYDDAGAQWDIDPNLLRAVDMTESHGDPTATSPAGAQGNMQFMPATARGVAVANPADPNFSVPGAAKLLHDLREGPAQGDITTALRMYHGGPDPSKWGPANAAYAPAVFANLQKINAQQPPVPGTLGFNPARMSDAELAAHLDQDVAAAGIKPGTATSSATATPPIAGLSDAQLQALLEQDVAAAKAPAPSATPPQPGEMPGDAAIRADLTPGSPNFPGLTTQETAAFGAGMRQGVRNLGITANRLIGDPFGMLPGETAARDAYTAQYGDNGAARLGEMASSTAATLPIMEVVNPLVSRAVGAGANALTSAFPSIASKAQGVMDFLGGNYGAATETTPARPLASTLSNSASGGLQGAEAAAINSGQSDQPLAQQMRQGAIAGGLAGAVPAALGYGANALTGASGLVDPEMANLARNARDMYDVPLKAPSLGLNPALGYVNSTLKFVPGSGVGADEAATQAKWQAAINREMGESGTKIFGTTVNNALKRAGNVIETIGNRTDLDLANDPTALTQLANIEHQATQPISGLNDSQINQVKAHIDKIQNIAAANNGVIPGPTYLNLIRKGEALDNLQNSESPTAAGFGNQIRDVLDQTLANSAAPGDAAALQQARYQYKVAKTVQPLTARSDSATGGPQPTAGNISPVALRGAVLSPSAFGPNAALANWGDVPLWDLARIGQRMRDPAQSGTAPREAVQNFLTHVGQVGASALAGGAGYATGEIPLALGALAGGMTAGRAIGAGLRSQTLANRMIDSSLNPLAYQVSPNPLARSALAALAASRANQLSPTQK
jgi:hypothetical protein